MLGIPLRYLLKHPLTGIADLAADPIETRSLWKILVDEAQEILHGLIVIPQWIGSPRKTAEMIPCEFSNPAVCMTGMEAFGRNEMSFVTRRLAAFSTAVFLLAASESCAFAQNNYDPGVTDTEIKIGNTMPYSGAISSYSTIGKTEAAYFNKINAEGGINGRKIKFISYDDASNPAKTVEQVRKLVEGDEVFLIFQSLGGAMNIAIEKYLNNRKVPQLFVAAPNQRFGDPQNFPWTMGWQPTAANEGRIYAQYLLENHPNTKIGVLYVNADVGKEYLAGLKDGLGGKLQVVAEVSFELTDPTMDSHVVTLKNSGADVIFLAAPPKAAVQAIRKMAELDWKPIRLLASISNSVGAVMKPAGTEIAKGILSAAFLKDPSNPLWKDDPAVKEWEAFMAAYYPEGDRIDTFTVYGYLLAQTMAHVLRQCGGDLSRENVMRQAANIKELELGLLLPGIRINTSPTDYFPVKHMRMTRFNGKTLELVGPLYSGAVASN